MNRRKAIYSIFLLGGGIITTYSGFKWYELSKDPDIGFLEKQKELIADLAENIIPRTSTPGAKDVGASVVIISLIKKAADRKTQNNFINGLKDVERYSSDGFGKSFTLLNAVQQHAVVNYFYKKGKNYPGKVGKAKNKILGKSFFEILKYYTTVSYCTSQRGATEGLSYSYIPGQFLPCMDLASNQKSWATK